MIPGIDGLFSPATSEAIARTFLATLWQGLLIGLVLASGLRAMAHRPAAERYAWCLAGMAFMLAAPMITFAIFRSSGSTLSTVAAPAGVSSTLAPLFPWLTFGWLAGATFLQLRLLVAWVQAHVAVRRASPLRSDTWVRCVSALGTHLGVTQAVRVLESRFLSTPAVVGWLRPVILLPVGFVNALPAAQIRAILAHELAHIRRHDFLVNILQGVFESLLFFHPVTWWLSKRLRVEREFCCDDAALAVCPSRLEYARALSAIEEIRQATVSFAVPAKGGDLVSRIHRLIGRDSNAGPLHGKSSVSLMTILLTGALVWVVAVACDSDDASTASPVAVTESDSPGATGATSAKLHLAEVHDALMADVEAGRLTKEEAIAQFEALHAEFADELHDIKLHESADATWTENDAEHNVFFHDDDSASLSFDVEDHDGETVIRVNRNGQAEPVMLEFMKDATPDEAHRVVLEKIEAGELSTEEGKAALYKLLESRTFGASAPFGEPTFEFEFGPAD